MEIYQCEQCDYSGDGVQHASYKDGTPKSFRCPVCLSVTVKDKSSENAFYTKNSLKGNVLWPMLFVWGFMGAGAGLLFCFNREADTAATLTVFLFILGGWGYHKYQMTKQHNAFIQRRISEYKETGKVPSLE